MSQTQPDSLVPGAGNPLAWDRYAYTLNNPVRYTDPSGHFCADVGTTQICSTDPDSNGYWGNNFDRKIDIDRNGWISEREAERYFVNNLRHPGDGLSVTNRFGGPCTTQGCPNGSVHAAVDFSGNMGSKTSIKAAYDGYVTGIWTNEAADLGLKVVLEHNVFGHKFYSVYAHLSYIDPNLTRGQFVTAGTVLGLMGNTSYPEGAIHLHFEVRKSANIRWNDQRHTIVTGDSKSYWALSYEDMITKFLNLGPRFGYSPYYPASWPKQ